jgi:uncharacterized protein YcnI
MPLQSAPSPTRRRTRRVVGALVGAAALTLGAATAASAHVRVTPTSTAAGSSSLLTFRIPTESDTASTTALTVDLPTATPFTSVSVQAVAGWTATVEKGALPKPVTVDGAELTQAPLHVVWTADADAAVPPGQFQLLTISVSPLPAAGTRLVLPAHQTYSDGTVVDWADVADPGAAEPEHPAPELTTTALTTTAQDADATPADATDDVARWLGGAGVVLGLVAVVVAVTSRRVRSTP